MVPQVPHSRGHSQRSNSPETGFRNTTFGGICVTTMDTDSLILFFVPSGSSGFGTSAQGMLPDEYDLSLTLGVESGFEETIEIAAND